MDIRPTRIFSLGDNAVTAEFGNEISERLNSAAISLARYFNEEPFPGLIEAVPAMASTTLFFDPAQVRGASGSFETAFGAVEEHIRAAAAIVPDRQDTAVREIEIPVSFSTDNALDLESVASHASLSPADVVEIFTSRSYRVFMLGFLPGFAYMGEVDERIAAPRLATPRTAVPKGSVGIAGRQTGIYPSASPGGWQIIGRTDIELITPGCFQPCLFSPGDLVRFVPT